jgi:hypothetical protein
MKLISRIAIGLAGMVIGLLLHSPASAVDIQEAADEHKFAAVGAVKKWDNPKKIFFCEDTAKTCTGTDTKFSDILSLENVGGKGMIDFTSDGLGKGLLTGAPGAGDLTLIEPADPSLGISIFESINDSKGKQNENITLFGEGDPNPKPQLSDRLTFCTVTVTGLQAEQAEQCVPDTVTDVPEPSTLLLFAASLIGYACWRSTSR